MLVITKKGLAEDVPEAWAKRYKNYKHEDKKAITSALAVLTLEERTPERVNKIIGNSSWTDITCDECGEDVDIAVIVGTRLFYDAPTVIACRKCLTEALSLLDE